MMSYARTSGKSVMVLMLCAGFLLSACKESTQVSGLVTDQAGQAIDGVSVTLGYSEPSFSAVQTNAQGQYDITFEENCFIFCGGGNPELSAQLDGYSPSHALVTRFDSSTHDFVLTRSETVNNDANGVYALDRAICAQHGGQIGGGGSAADTCTLGAVLAVFECATSGGSERISVIARSEQDILIERSGGAFETLIYAPSGSGEKFVGEHTTFWTKADEATLITADGQFVCNAVDG